jgi:hypothetical protein
MQNPKAKRKKGDPQCLGRCGDGQTDVSPLGCREHAEPVALVAAQHHKYAKKPPMVSFTLTAAYHSKIPI